MSSVVFGSDASSVSSKQQQIHALRGLIVFKWLNLFLVPAIGIGFGAFVGYAIHRYQPKIYEATALIELTNADPSSEQSIDSSILPRQDVELSAVPLVMRSQKVLRIAVGKGRLTEQQHFDSLSTEEIVDELRSSENLQIAIRNQSTSVAHIEVTYSVDDPELASLVVNAIVDGYSEYLDEEYRTKGARTYNLITDAQDNLQSRYRELNGHRLQFQKETQCNANVVWNAEGASDPYREDYDRYNEHLSNARLERQQISASLAAAKERLADGESADAILLSLAEFDCTPPIAPPAADGENGESSEEESDELAKERLELCLRALGQKGAALLQQEQNLMPLIAGLREQSNELSLILSNNAILESEIQTVKELLVTYTQKLQTLESNPVGNRTQLEELSLPSIGELKGPKLLSYLIAGSLICLLPAIAIATILFRGATGAIAEREAKL